MNTNRPTLDDVRNALSGFQPFTITVNTTEELMFLFNACLFQIASCDRAKAKLFSEYVGHAMVEFGPVGGAEDVKRFLNQVGRKNVPPWFYPMLTHIFTHFESQKKGNNDK